MAALIFGDVAALKDPLLPQRGKSLFDITIEVRISPRPTGIIDPNSRIFLERAVERFSWGKLDLPHWHANLRMDLPAHVDTTGFWQRRAALRLDGAYRCTHSQF
jgi:hypothetical protein